MMLLEYARGGWVNVIHGNLELLSENDGLWFAKAQNMFMKLQEFGRWSTFGAIPGTAKPYGFKCENMNGSVITIVNPAQAISTIEMPVDMNKRSAVIFTDSGFKPAINHQTIALGPEQLAIIGFGEYADDKYFLGVDDALKIPVDIRKLNIPLTSKTRNTISASLTISPGKYIRIVLQQFGNDGFPYRSWGGAPPDGKKMDAFLKIDVKQGKKTIPLHIEYDKMIWSGLSWAVGEIKPANLDSTKPIEIVCFSADETSLMLKGDVYE